MIRLCTYADSTVSGLSLPPVSRAWVIWPRLGLPGVSRARVNRRLSLPPVTPVRGVTEACYSTTFVLTFSFQVRVPSRISRYIHLVEIRVVCTVCECRFIVTLMSQSVCLPSWWCWTAWPTLLFTSADSLSQK